MAEAGDLISLPTVDLEFGSSTEADIEWETEGVFESISGGGGSAGVGSQIVTNQMQELLTLEMEEHAILTEMFNLSMDPLNMHTDNSIDFNVYDWPAFQALQRRLFVVQVKMKKMFLVMKLRAEFFSLIGVRLADIERQQMSSSMDSIFQSHFSQVSDSVEKLSQIMMSMQSISQSNYDVYDNRYKSVWELGFTTPMNIILGLTSALVPENGPAIVAAFQAFTGVLIKIATFFGNPYNAYNLKDNESIRESSKMVGLMRLLMKLLIYMAIVITLIG